MLSLHETPLTRKYWQQIGGTLVEEFPIIMGTKYNGRRVVDAIILPDEEFTIKKPSEVDIRNKRVICVQTKKDRLGMYLMGQVLFSMELIKEKFSPSSITSVAICTVDDIVLRPLLEKYKGLKVVIINEP